MLSNTRRKGFHTALGHRIHVRREELGLTLTEMADQMGMARGHLSQVENGLAGLTLWSAAAIAKALGWSLDRLTEDLLWRDDQGHVWREEL